MVTEQMAAKIRVQQLWGQKAATRDTMNYRQVECTVDGKRFWAIGQTWDEAITNLQAKVPVL